MNSKIYNVLKKLIDLGYEAYVIGGFTRDYLLGKSSYDVDIATSATPKEVKEIFDLSSSNEENYGHVFFKDSLYNYDITTFRKESRYENRRPVEYEFIKDVSEDVLRRDFTINGLFMDIDGNIHDIVEGKKDLDNKLVRVIGNIDDKMIEDPLRLLRAVRFAAILDFEIEERLFNYIKQNKQLLRTLSNTRKKEELDKIFKNQKGLKGIELIRELNISEELEIMIPDDISYTSDHLGIWAQISYGDNYTFKKNEEETIYNIRKIIDYGIIDSIVLYEYGLYAATIAGEILGESQVVISDIYKNMPIYTVKDIKINGNDIIDILGIEPSEKIKDILFDIEINILNRTLDNDFEAIKNYLLMNWR